jgi:protein tyrosine phosphatase
VTLFTTFVRNLLPKLIRKIDPRSLFRTATLAENVARNRFKDVLPYDENRVRLASGEKVFFHKNYDDVMITILGDFADFQWENGV